MTPALFQLEPPAGLFPELAVTPEEARSILRPQRDDRYGFGLALSPYRGCAHACRYCYVREYPQPNHPASDWGNWVTPKLNAPELLWSQRHRLHGQTVFLASATDPYQSLERHYRLTRGCLEVLLQCTSTQVRLHTRSPLILQDLELLKAFGDRLSVGFSIPTDDDTVRQVVEPKAPPIPSRWAAVERLCAAGLRVVLAVTPLMPMQDPAVFARRALASGVAGAWVGGLRLLKDDPFHDLLVSHDWLAVLTPEYQEEVRAALAAVFPSEPKTGRRRLPAKAGPVRLGGAGLLPGSALGPALGGRGAVQQPCLFEGF